MRPRIDGNYADRTTVQSGENVVPFREFTLAYKNQRLSSDESVWSIPIFPRMSAVIPGDSRWRQSQKKYTGDRRDEGVTFLRGVYHVRMRGVLRSFAYILKRRSSTAPNMLAQREKKREGGRKDEGKQKYPFPSLSLPFIPTKKGREKEEGKMDG